MGSLKFEVNDFIKEYSKKDFIRLCDKFLDMLENVLDDKYILSNIDSVDRRIYDEVLESKFCIEKDLKCLGTSTFLHGEDMKKGIKDVCIALAVDGLDLVLVFESGEITSVEYYTNNGYIYELKDELEDYLKTVHIEYEDNCRILVSLTVGRKHLVDYRTPKQGVLERISNKDFSELQIRGILPMDRIYNNCFEELLGFSDFDIGIDKEDFYEASDVEIGESSEEIKEYLEDIKNIYKDGNYDYTIKGVLIVDCKECLVYNRYNDIENTREVIVDDIVYQQGYNSVEPKCILREVNSYEGGVKNSEIRFSSVAELLKHEYVKESIHVVTDSKIFGVVPYEENKNYWGIISNY